MPKKTFLMIFVCLFILMISTTVFAQEPTLVMIDSVSVIGNVDGALELEITGNFRNGCEGIGDIEVEIADTTIIISVYASRPAGLVTCTQALEPFTERIFIDAGDLESASYTLVVNGVNASMTVDENQSVDNLSDSMVSTCPTAIDGESYAYNGESLGVCFLYPISAQLFEFDATTTDSQSVALSIPVDGDIIGLTITSEEADNDTSLTLIQSLEDINEADAITYSAIVIANQFALVVDDGEANTRQAWIIFDEMLYSITLQPADTDTAQDLWDSVINSFAPVNIEADAMSVADLQLELPETWDMGLIETGLTITLPDDETSLITLSSSQTDDPVSYYTDQFDDVVVDTLDIADTTLDTIVGIENTCVILLVPVDENIIEATIAIDGCVPETTTLIAPIMDWLETVITSD